MASVSGPTGPMSKEQIAAMMWKRFLMYEQLLINKHGLASYKEQIVFTIDNEPKKNCKYCYGRGYIGWDKPTGRVTPCGCLKGFALCAKVDLEDKALAMDFGGNIFIAQKEEPQEPEDA